MTSRLSFILTTLLLSALAHNVVAGPDWQAIETARANKQEKKVVVEKKITAHEMALQKLIAACEKVKEHMELAEACREIIAADTEINK